MERSFRDFSGVELWFLVLLNGKLFLLIIFDGWFMNSCLLINDGKLQILIAYSSLFSSFLVERAGEKVGLSCLILLLFISCLSVAYARVFNDLRLCMTFQLIPCLVIPVMAVLLPPKYTHSRFWLWATAAYTIAKIEGLADNKIYNANRYIISGHSLEHLCSAVATLLLTIMLLYRSIRFNR